MSELFVLATPIGNLQDASPRFKNTLNQVDLILCEDTRVTKKLLSYYQIAKPVLSYHQHSSLKKEKYILEQIQKGKKLALVSDAGTPSISDPGSKLIEFLLKEKPLLKITPIPGPTALAAALSIAGWPADKFLFLGFPPVKKKRKKFFQEIEKAKYTVVFYESPHRINKSLAELNPQAEVVVCRELTKKFETIYRGQVQKVMKQIKPKGEFVIVVKHA
jgi:16S rRNA (cytidine1402-2'-O)-methyltransferase